MHSVSFYEFLTINVMDIVKRNTLVSAVIIGIIFLMVFTLRENKTKEEIKFSTHLIEINKKLYSIYQESNGMQLHQAQNTFLDLQGDWETLDVLAKTLGEHLILSNYYPADSLYKLRSLIDDAANRKEGNVILIKNEIKKLNDRIDEIKISRQD